MTVWAVEMTGVRKPVENHSRSLPAMISASWFSTVSLSPWKARYTPPTFPHSHSPKPFLYLFHTHLRAFGAQERSPLVAMTQPSSFRLILQLENAALRELPVPIRTREETRNENE